MRHVRMTSLASRLDSSGTVRTTPPRKTKPSPRRDLTQPSGEGEAKEKGEGDVGPGEKAEKQKHAKSSDISSPNTTLSPLSPASQTKSPLSLPPLSPRPVSPQHTSPLPIPHNLDPTHPPSRLLPLARPNDHTSRLSASISPHGHTVLIPRRHGDVRQTRGGRVNATGIDESWPGWSVSVPKLYSATPAHRQRSNVQQKQANSKHRRLFLGNV
mmetsp:Transcript_22237/g.48391  ORF Transcript_22237/g.48391 Transcript_22237/m.48391 type:complete len:213 (-) Transcript_22237:639-1277(-)